MQSARQGDQSLPSSAPDGLHGGAPRDELEARRLVCGAHARHFTRHRVTRMARLLRVHARGENGLKAALLVIRVGVPWGAENRASPEWHSGGRQFDPVQLHHLFCEG